MRGTKRRLYGSTAKTRQMVLAALGVVKVATAEQIRQLMCPGTASAQTIRKGSLDLGRDGLESFGPASRTNAAGNLVTEKLWNLTGPGLEPRPRCWIGRCGRWAALRAAPRARGPATCRTAPRATRWV
ncbi:hypothetical protein [Streptomyces nigrescens]|uniref:hypothetical protein n=1 Tax=Streptomyces nigrescens TaxID=1920 RepID=UPI0021C2B1CC|nr:hypothetical protein [Streptomyces nigrescens]